MKIVHNLCEKKSQQTCYNDYENVNIAFQIHNIIQMEAFSMLETNKNHATAWQGFKNGRWNRHVDVREFIQLNYTLYEGNDSFLAGPTEATSKLWEQVMQLSKEERGTWRHVGYGHESSFNNHIS